MRDKSNWVRLADLRVFANLSPMMFFLCFEVIAQLLLPVGIVIRLVGIRAEVKPNRATLRQVAWMIVYKHIGTDLAENDGFAEFPVGGVVRIVNP